VGLTKFSELGWWQHHEMAAVRDAAGPQAGCFEADIALVL
jgi:hypothetical protein